MKYNVKIWNSIIVLKFNLGIVCQFSADQRKRCRQRIVMTDYGYLKILNVCCWTMSNGKISDPWRNWTQNKKKFIENLKQKVPCQMVKSNTSIQLRKKCDIPEFVQAFPIVEKNVEMIAIYMWCQRDQ